MVTYTTAAKVASLLQYTELSDDEATQIRKVFDADSLPTVDEVEDLIEEMETIIEQYCEQSWRLNTKTNEYYDYLTRLQRGRHYDRSGRSLFTIELKNKHLRVIDGNEGDKIEVWTNSEWKDFVADLTLGDAMYEGDYWIDYHRSVIHLFTNFPSEGQNMIRVTYRFGATTVPAGIQRATTLMVGAAINERYEMYKDVSKDTSPAMNMADKWRELADKLMHEFAYFEVEVI